MKKICRNKLKAFYYLALKKRMRQQPVIKWSLHDYDLRCDLGYGECQTK